MLILHYSFRKLILPQVDNSEVVILLQCLQQALNEEGTQFIVRQMQLFESLDIFLDHWCTFCLFRRLPFSKIVFPAKIVAILGLITYDSRQNVPICINNVIVV